MSGPISVLIAEDSLLGRDSVDRALSTDADATVVGIAEDYDHMVELVEKHQPAMLLTDVRMPPTSTDEGIRFAEATDCGAAAYLHRENLSPDLLTRLWRAAL